MPNVYSKFTDMSIQDKRTHAHQLIDSLDETFFEAVYQVMATYAQRHEERIVGYDELGTPVRAIDLVRGAEQSIAKAKHGEGYKVEDLRKRRKG